MTKNQIKEPPKAETQPKQKSSGGNIVTRNVSSVLSGAFLSKEKTIRSLPFIFFITFMVLCYIANGFYAEDQIRKMNKITNELKNLRSEYVLSKCELNDVSQRKEVVKRSEAIGLKESVAEQPMIISVSSKK
jgi:hypothetical protein